MTFRKVNIRSDVSGRTLLAWYCLLVMRYFMPVDTMLLLQPTDRSAERGFNYDK